MSVPLPCCLKQRKLPRKAVARLTCLKLHKPRMTSPLKGQANGTSHLTHCRGIKGLGNKNRKRKIWLLFPTELKPFLWVCLEQLSTTKDSEVHTQKQIVFLVLLPISSNCALDHENYVSVAAKAAQYPRNTYEEHLTKLLSLCSCNLTLTNLVLWSCVIHISPEN